MSLFLVPNSFDSCVKIREMEKPNRTLQEWVIPSHVVRLKSIQRGENEIRYCALMCAFCHGSAKLLR
jgi:hypothetical protein